MAEELPQKKPKQSGIFLCCFGSKASFKAPDKTTKEKRARRLYWSEFAISKSAASTVPVEAAAAAIVATVKTAVESEKSGAIRKYGRRRPRPPVSAAAKDGPEAEEVRANNVDSDLQKPGQTETKDASPRKRSFQRDADRITTIAGGQSDASRKKPPPADPVTTPSTARQDRNSNNQSDPIVGMSIVMVILIVLVSCGQLCAILCTAAWFYIIRRLRSSADRTGVNKAIIESSQAVDLSSEEYKKKVVLEGLLERNRRASPVK